MAVIHHAATTYTVTWLSEDAKDAKDAEDTGAWGVVLAPCRPVVDARAPREQGRG